MSDVIDIPADIESVPIEVKICELCGSSIDDLDELIYLRAGDLITQWELADPRDAWRYRGEKAPPALNIPSEPARPYRTPQATVDAFRYVVRLDDADYLRRWLAQHPHDAPYILKIWEHKNALA